MTLNSRFVGFAAVGSLLLGQSFVAAAGQKTLEFKLIVQTTDWHSIDVPNVTNQAIGQGHAFGVAIFKDGRIGVKDFAFSTDYNKNGTSTSYGYSTYTFDDGSSITARFSDEAVPNKPEHGVYKILSGTGAYAGATGSGTYDSVKSPFKNNDIYSVKLIITTP